MDGCAYMFEGRLYTNAINYMRWPNFHTCIGSGHFFCGGGGGGVKNLNFNIFGVFSENEYFLGYEICGYFLGSITKLDYI